MGVPFGDFLLDISVIPGATPSMFGVEYCETTGLTPPAFVWGTPPPRADGEVFYTLDNPVLADQAHGGPFPFTVESPEAPIDLGVTKTLPPLESVAAGDILTYTIAVSNLTEREASGLLTDFLPAGTKAADIQFHPWNCGSSECDITVTVAPGDTEFRSLSVEVTDPSEFANSGTEIINIATISAGGDTNSENDRVVLSTPVPFPDLVITKDADDTTVAGGLLHYIIMVRNVGTGTADDAKISDIVPQGTTFVADGPSGGSDVEWSCEDGASAGTTCTISTDHDSKTDGISNIALPGLRPGEFVLIDFVVRVDDHPPDRITNRAAVLFPPEDPTPTNNLVEHVSVTSDDDEGDGDPSMIRDTGNWGPSSTWSFFTTGGTAPPSDVPCDISDTGGGTCTFGAQFVVTVGASPCIDVSRPSDPGTFTDPGPSTCSPCLPGSYSDADGTCVPCDDPSAPTGLAACLPCLPGSYSDADGTCVPCDDPSAPTGAAACLPCEVGTFPGFTGGDGSDSCVVCPKGTYSSALVGDVVCVPDGAGSVHGEVIVAATTTLERRGNLRAAQDGSQPLPDPLSVTRNLGPLNADPAGLQWYRLEEDGWVALPTSVDYVNGSASFTADTTGRYVLFIGAVRDIPLPAGTAALGFHGAPGTPPDLLQGQLEDPGALDAIFQFRSGAWLSFRPGGLAILNSLTSIDANAPLFLVLSRATRWAGPINPSGDRDVPIASGFTSFTYTGADAVAPDQLVGQFGSPGVVIVIFLFDNALSDDQGGYRTFRTTGPAVLSDLDVVATFDVLFVLAERATSLSLPGG